MFLALWRWFTLAVMQGEAAGENIAAYLKGAKQTATWDERLNIFGIFTDPELVELGWNQDEAIKRGFDPVYKPPIVTMIKEKAKLLERSTALFRSRADRKTGQILGAAGIGPHIIDYAHTMMVALHQNLTVAEFLKIPSYHPTLGEIWTYVAEELMEEL